MNSAFSGYGSITPKTRLGQGETIIFCTIGIPMTMPAMKSLGELLAIGVRSLTPETTVKITFSCGNYNIFKFLSCCLPETRTKDQIRGPRTIENGRLFANSKQNIYVWNLKLQDYRQEHKSYLQGVFQLVT